MVALDAEAPRLLAVDLGLKLGLALWSGDGALLSYRSHNLGNRSRLRRAIPALLDEHTPLGWLFLEGDRSLARLWEGPVRLRAIELHLVAPHEWRRALQLEGVRDPKEAAERLARQVIATSPARQPTSLRHDAAEAILLGLYGAIRVGLRGQPR